MAVQPHPCCHVRHCRLLSGITPLIQQNLVESSGVEKNTALAIGALSGAILAGTITHPMDTIKTCMQAGLAAASRPAGTTATAHTRRSNPASLPGVSVLRRRRRGEGEG